MSDDFTCVHCGAQIAFGDRQYIGAIVVHEPSVCRSILKSKLEKEVEISKKHARAHGDALVENARLMDRLDSIRGRVEGFRQLIDREAKLSRADPQRIEWLRTIIGALDGETVVERQKP